MTGMATNPAASPIEAGTHVADLPEAAPYMPPLILTPAEIVPPEGQIELGASAPAWLGATAKLIRPLCVGALMAIPTIGAASVGLAAIFDRDTALAMADASTRFLAGIPAEIVALIGFLAGGYTVARSAEKIVGELRR